MLCSQSLGGIHEDDYVRSLLEHGVAGIIFVSGMHAIADIDPGRYQRLTDSGLPVVLINGFLPGVGAACIATDDARVIDLAVAHLAHMGHSRIGLALGQDRYTPVRRKAAASPTAMREHVDPGLTDADLDSLIECTTFTVAGGTQAALALLDRGVTGIVCGSDVMALGVLRAARQRGLQVPRDLSVIGSDDSSLIEFTDPPLTTVRQPSLEMAAAGPCSARPDRRGHPLAHRAPAVARAGGARLRRAGAGEIGLLPDRLNGARSRHPRRWPPPCSHAHTWTIGPCDGCV